MLVAGSNRESQQLAIPGGLFMHQPVIETLTGPSGTHVILIGTNHISAASVKTVSDVVLSRQPAVVVVELCAVRSGRNLEAPLVALGDANGFVWPGFSTLALSLASYMTGTVFQDEGVTTGMEMKTAVLLGRKIGARVLAGVETCVYIYFTRTYVYMFVFA